MDVVPLNATQSLLRYDFIFDQDKNGDEDENEDRNNVKDAGAAEAVPPRGPNAPVYDLARHILPPVKV